MSCCIIFVFGKTKWRGKETSYTLKRSFNHFVEMHITDVMIADCDIGITWFTYPLGMNPIKLTNSVWARTWYCLLVCKKYKINGTILNHRADSVHCSTDFSWSWNRDGLMPKTAYENNFPENFQVSAPNYTTSSNRMFRESESLPCVQPTRAMNCNELSSSSRG